MPHCELHFPEDHATAAGHFPGNPILPGALLLDTVLHAIAGNSAAAHICTVRAAKFLRPVRPGDRLRHEWEHRGGETQFRCTLLNGEILAMTGTLRLANNM
jgi:3-hydroxyacyl-[acyl-carrier-protein] dehydratase